MNPPPPSTIALSSVSVEIYRDFDASLQTDWDRLFDQGQSGRAQSCWTWQRTWWKHYGHEGSARIFVANRNMSQVASRSKQAQAILPLHRTSLSFPFGFVTALQFIGGQLADYHQPIVGGDDLEPALDAIFAAVTGTDDWKVLDFLNLPPSAFDLLSATAERAGLSTVSWPLVGCRWLTLHDSFESYRSSLSRNTRRDLTKKRTRFESAGDVSFFAATEPEDIAKVWSSIGQLNRSRWQAAGQDTSLFESSQTAAFIEDFVSQLAGEGRVVLFGLTRDGETSAYHLCHRSHGVLSSWNAGWNPEHAAFSPGRLLEEDLIRWAHDQEFRAVDFMRGDYRYKSSWTDEVRTNRRLVIARSTFLLRAIRGYETALRPFLRERLSWLAQKTRGMRSRKIS